MVTLQYVAHICKVKSHTCLVVFLIKSRLWQVASDKRTMFVDICMVLLELDIVYIVSPHSVVCHSKVYFLKLMHMFEVKPYSGCFLRIEIAIPHDLAGNYLNSVRWYTALSTQAVNAP